MSDQTPSLAPIDPGVIHRSIANGFRQLANYHDQLAGPIPGTKSVAPTTPAADPDAEAKAAAKAKKAEEKAAAKAKVDAEAAAKAKADEKPEMTPAEIAADLKAKLVALVGKDRAKAVSLLATIGAKNFSGIPVEKHAEMHRKVSEALAPPAAADDDPLA